MYDLLYVGGYNFLGEIKEILSWRAHNQGCPVYGMAYRNNVNDVAQGDAGQNDVPNRLFTSSCNGEVKQWDPTNGCFEQMTIITVRTIYDAIYLIATLCNFTFIN